MKAIGHLALIPVGFRAAFAKLTAGFVLFARRTRRTRPTRPDATDLPFPAATLPP